MQKERKGLGAVLPRKCTFYILLGMAICILSACQAHPNVSPTRAPLEPGSLLYHPEPSRAISPDGKYVAATEINSQSVRLIAIPLEDTTEGAILRPTAATWTDRHTLDYKPLGWASAGRLVYVASGVQDQGPNAGEQGVAVWVSDVQAGASEQIGFVPLPNGWLLGAYYSAVQAKVHVRIHAGVTTAVWVVDLVKKDTRLVKDGLPSYDGLFMIRLSSDGACWAYTLGEPDRQGLCILSTETGDEKVAMPLGETRSYGPAWSPDGKYLAVYTAPRNPEWGGIRSNGYEMWYGENGPFPMGPRISILDQSGSVVKSISIPGKVLGYFEWTRDSASLLFAAGDNPGPGGYAPKPGDMIAELAGPVVRWEGLWMTAVEDSGSPALQVADFSNTAAALATAPHIYDMDASGKGIIFSTWRAGTPEESVIWYAPLNEARDQVVSHPVRVTDGAFFSDDAIPATGDSTPVLIQSTSANNTVSLWLLGPGGFEKTEEAGARGAGVLGFSRDILLIGHSASGGSGKITVHTLPLPR